MKEYGLPEIVFVGGETKELAFRLFTETGRIFIASGATATFSVVSSTNKTGAPLISKPMSVIADENQIESVLTVSLLPTETVNLFGKYVYQITIRDVSGKTEIPRHGVLRISNNIDKNIIV